MPCPMAFWSLWLPPDHFLLDRWKSNCYYRLTLGPEDGVDPLQTLRTSGDWGSNPHGSIMANPTFEIVSFLPDASNRLTAYRGYAIHDRGADKVADSMLFTVIGIKTDNSRLLIAHSWKSRKAAIKNLIADIDEWWLRQREF